MRQMVKLNAGAGAHARTTRTAIQIPAQIPAAPATDTFSADDLRVVGSLLSSSVSHTSAGLFSRGDSSGSY